MLQNNDNGGYYLHRFISLRETLPHYVAPSTFLRLEHFEEKIIKATQSLNCITFFGIYIFFI